MKLCITCKCRLDEVTCSPSQLGRTGAKCKKCTREYSKAHYIKNREKYIALSRTRAKNYTEFNVTKLLLFLSNQKCADCGEIDPITLEFDHLENKLCNIAGLWGRLKNWDKIQEEIDKCDVVCGNCHKKRTAKRGNFMKYKLLKEI